MGLSKRSSSAVKIQAPKRVVRSLRNYVARECFELTFKKDDFFYVLSTPHENDQWYEVTNPLTGERGLVPASHFEVLESRQDRINRINRSASNASATGAAAPLGIPRSMPADASLYGRQSPEPGSLLRPSGSNASSPGYPSYDIAPATALRVHTTSIQHQQHAHHQRTRSPAPAGARTPEDPPAIIELHATALYGFAAANSNELSISEGDDLLVVAQSTEDWLVARPVHGGAAPALVPASYLQLHDHITGAAVGDLRAFLARHRIRLRTAPEWERHRRELRASRSTHSSASASSELTTAAHAGRAASPASSAYDEDQSPTPRSSIGSILPAPAMGIQKSRTRALTASSSTSSIAERSSFRQLHKSRQVSGGSSLQHLVGENFPPFRPREVATVAVPSFICKDGAYLFQISLQFASGELRNVYRAYEDIICCRNQLNESFPEATAPLKLARVSMHSSSMLYLNDAIAERRRNEIDEYVSGLLAMPDDVVASPVVQRLFGSRAGPLPDHLQHALDRSARHASHESASTPASASSTDTAVEQHHCAFAGSAHKAKTMSCDSKAAAGVASAAARHQQLAHKTSMSALGGAGATVKVKVRFGDDMVALRLPSELTLQELKARIAMKMCTGEAASSAVSISKIVYCAPSGESAPLRDDQDWADALLATNNKPVLTIVQ
ncbi:bud emergence protein 1 [Coemansia biformis]|uniref:Bud emergence protein 1 n=1 Tax=Coemansia biformis TaxID=1286918 RepID=A0A9W7YCV5_9FUNG|nr:bud emergence protein 1 [Coemansia biformis]